MNTIRHIGCLLLLSLALAACNAMSSLPPRPTPTIAFEDNWASSRRCRLPCWEDLTPGTTTYTEAVQLLRQSARAELVSPEQDAQLHLTGSYNPASPLIRQRNSKKVGGYLSFDYDPQGQPYLLYEIVLRPDPAVTLNEVVGWFGYPSAYSFPPMSYDAKDQGYLLLYYDKYQMQVMTAPMQRPEKTWEINWSQPILQIHYLSPQASASRLDRCAWRSTTTLAVNCS